MLDNILILHFSGMALSFLSEFSYLTCFNQIFVIPLTPFYANVHMVKIGAQARQPSTNFVIEEHQ